ncbi:AAA family ATPase [Pseudomonas sp. GOM7]|uniref:AAA family ATPase n=1 Tax=Pseudomonas sp. GOM7 TaxID=2998079 RepID=UPI00227D46F0|nr:AAA family ATPase [Pseudomonas sp. GOM7]WAJ39224.1 AAA family ATPase [Pseudomonas sp. GOM7]
MNWKISRIEIASFKAFKHISLNLESASLLTLDGPNGFGKTSIFDAIELLLTGKIARIERLFDKVMIGTKKRYEDNLFWNARSQGNDLHIKIEFKSNDEKIVLARHAPSESLWPKDKNKANDFSLFKLYKLDNFESTDFTDKNLKSDDLISELFGQNFQENYSFLNYLEQGQNEYLFSTSLNNRKKALESLIQSGAIVAEINKCKRLEKKLTQRLSKDRLEEESRLDRESQALRAMLENGLEGVTYEKLSTADIQPSWDKEVLFSGYSKEIHDNYVTEIRNIIDLLPLKQAIKIRISNEKIETYISKNNNLLRALIQVGKTTGELAALSVTKSNIDFLSLSLSTLEKGAASIGFDEIRTTPGWQPDEFLDLEEQIKSRDLLNSSSAANAAAIAEISKLKKELLENHFKIYPNDNTCPLCSQDWKSHEELLSAIEKRAQKLSESLSEDGKKLVQVIESIAKAISVLTARVNSDLKFEKSNYDPDLHRVLRRHKEIIQRIQDLGNQLTKRGILYPDTYTVDPEEEEKRLADLIALFRAQKQEEVADIPDQWSSVISTAFKDETDFYVLERDALETKLKYISLKANEAKSTTLIGITQRLDTIRKENKATTRIKERIASLRGTLERVEKAYSDQTISEIELVFHVYSGRLIQNYQRGLGLFIESKDGNQLRFATAEYSDHDAILSMSSGQISALSLAFFLSLNRVYSGVPIIMIDDPSQSLDEVNIASLTDLLRCELKDRQLIVSSHEDDISSYMRYRFTRADLLPLTFNMQALSREPR